MLTLRRGRVDELEVLYGTLRECAAFLRSRGIEQWQSLYPVERYRRDLENGLVHACEERDMVVGAVTIHRSPPDYYELDAWDLSRPAWYFCQLAIRRAQRGRGLGRQVIAAIESAALEAGCVELRIDIVPTNPFLERYYEALGFRRDGESRIRGGAVLLFSKPL